MPKNMLCRRVLKKRTQNRRGVFRKLLIGEPKNTVVFLRENPVNTVKLNETFIKITKKLQINIDISTNCCYNNNIGQRAIRYDRINN